MATTPTQRSYTQTLGDLIDAFLSEYGLSSLKVGGPVLSLFEAIAQSQFRNSEDIFTLLEATSLDFAEKDALDAIGNDEGVPRQTETPSSNSVTISDSSFTKIATTIFQGTPAPIVGSVAINIANGSLLPATGSVYLGRGTTNYEGPIAYTSVTNAGTYWILSLATGTQRFHNLNESVILAQGGNRLISSGTIVQTLTSTVVTAAQFSVLYAATLPDGETTLTGVTVVCTKPGTVGNVSANAIKSFTSPPFSGATVTNPTPFNNGLATEDDDTYRERIRAARKSRVKGTPLAITTAAIGTISPDDNKRVISAQLVTGQNKPTTLYVDDGTGYEEISQGVAIESLVDSALGGEQDFRLSSQPPVTKAQLVTTLSAPFSLVAGSSIQFMVGGNVTEHTFNTSDFRSISNATAYEVVASINANPNLLWSARTLGSGTLVVVFAKADTNESIQYIPLAENDANLFLGFTATRVDTIRLYKNDRLLSKDGSVASISSTSPSLWGTITGSQTLILAVDGIQLNFDGSMFPAFTSQDFINAATGFTSIGNNTPAAWAAVFNKRIPGVTATVNNGLVTLTSNRDYSATASIRIISGSLVTLIHMFTAQTVQGTNSDYSLNRNTGELQTQLALAPGDTLSAGSLSTRAFLQSSTIVPVTLGSTANLWLSVDGGAEIISTGLSPSVPIDISSTTKSWGKRARITSHSAASLFTNVLPGDWAICWDSTLQTAGLNGAYRVAAIDTTSFTWIEVESASTITPASDVFLVNTGLNIVRSSNVLQRIQIAAASNYTASSFAATLASVVTGATPTVYKTNSYRLATNSYNDIADPATGEVVGDIALVAADISGQQLALPVANATVNLTGHTASVESGNSEVGTPDFHMARVITGTDHTHLTVAWTTDPLSIETQPSTGHTFNGLRSVDDGVTSSLTRYGTNKGYRSPLLSVTSDSGNWDLVTEKAVETAFVPQDRGFFAHMFEMAPQDTTTIVVDGDTTIKRFTLNLGRTLATVGTTYAAMNAFTDADNGNQSLGIGFGINYNFDDCAIFMAARNITNSADTTRTILWRYARLGPDGNNARVQFQNPSGPNASVGYNVTNGSTGFTDIGITLSSGAARTGYTIRTTTNVGYAVTGAAGGMGAITYVLGFPIASGTRIANTPTLTLTLPSGITNHGLANGDTIYVTSTDSNYPSGAYVLTGTTASTITYNDASSSTSNFSGTGNVSYDSAGEATLTGGSVTTGDFFVLSANPAGTRPTMRITSVGAQTFTGSTPWSAGTSTTITWSIGGIGSTSNFQIFQNPAQTASALVTSFNTMAAASNGLCPITATLLGAGSGVIDRSSDEFASSSPTWVQLTDGVNYVGVTTNPGSPSSNYQFTFKNPITAGLASADWQHEVIKLMPRTAKNLVDWFSALTISGLSSVAEVVASSTAKKLQLASLTPGSAGTIQVQGGTANSLTAPILGSAVACTTSTNFIIASATAANVTGLYAGMYVRIDNGLQLPKSCIDSNTKLDSLTLGGGTATLVFDGSGTPVYTTTATASTSVAFLIERQGDFVALSDTGLASGLTLTSANEGDFIRITTPASPILDGTRQIAAANTGIYRVVRVVTPGLDGQGGTVWIENPNVIEQGVAEADVHFYASSSLMPGDTISISAPLWGAGNIGVWTVVSVGDNGSGPFTTAFAFKIDASQKTPQTIGSPVGALGAQASLVVPLEQTPGRWFKKIHSIVPNQANASLVDLKFTTSAGLSHINAAAQSTITALGKLAFPLTIAAGVDGYQHSVGLIGEVNRVIYGDPSDPATYPGVVAAGALINTSGALVKRIQVSILLRVRSGAPTKDIADQVRSAVAAVINNAGTGASIPLNALTTAAGQVVGVVSATMLSPLATTGSDLISVQPYEKPLVLAPETDILISFVGQ